jgi:aldehyde oxidoreductase
MIDTEGEESMKSVRLKINGVQRQFIVEDDLVLLDLLREELRLTGAKQSCDRKGQCGTCTVIVDKKAVRSCLTKVVDLEGADIITVEGLGTPDNPHLIQEAFVLTGAIQCGFCTPGMIMATKALLDTNSNPTVEEIKKALRRNLCRCTGYVKIIEAVQLAGQFLRGETTPDAVCTTQAQGTMGVSHPRPSAMAKACGTALFTADYLIQGALELAALCSEIPHARIVSIDTSEAEKMPGVAGVLTAADIKGTNILKKPPAEDRPLLAKDKVRYIGDPILAVAANTRKQAEDALTKVIVKFDPLPTLGNPAEAMAENAIRVHDKYPNLCFEHPQIKGDAETALQNSAAVIEARFKSQTNHQAPLEPEATIAYWEEGEKGDNDQLVVVGRSINIHAHLATLQEALGWENIRYIEAFTGGQFGIKVEIISEGIAAAAAIKFKRPVRYIPSLKESMLMTCKRFPYDSKVKLSADNQGKLTAYCNDFVVDSGPYNGSGQGVVNRSLLALSNVYNIPNIKARGRLVYTNNPWGSAARGAGKPEINFPTEVAVDMLAAKLGMDPFEFRLRNLLKPGQSLSCGYVVEEWPFPGLMEAIRPHYQRAVEEAAPFRSDRMRRGVGIAAGAHGIGASGDSAIAAVELDPDGGVSVYVACADPGEGNETMLTQLTATLMGISIDRVRLHTRDTLNTAASGPAAGSRITFMIGNAVANALEQLKAAMAETGAKTSSELEASGKSKRYTGRKKIIYTDPLDPQTGQGSAYESWAYSVQLAEVKVDTESGKVRVLKMTAAADVGMVIHPQNVTGQMEGGMDMGMGLALREKYTAGKTKDWVTFKFPTIEDSCPMEVVLVETPRLRGPLGATGVAEMSIMPSAPAVINAIKNAIGVWICDLPATPEKIKAALAAA